MQRIILLILILVSSKVSYSQFNAQHYKGIIAGELNGYSTQLGGGIRVGVTSYLSSQLFYKVAGYYEQGRLSGTLYQGAGLDGIFYYSPLNIREILFFNIGAGPTVGYEQLKNFIPEVKPLINYGIKGALELEVPLSDQIIIIGGLNQNYMFVKTFGSFRREIGLGLKIILN